MIPFRYPSLDLALVDAEIHEMSAAAVNASKLVNLPSSV